MATEEWQATIGKYWKFLKKMPLTDSTRSRVLQPLSVPLHRKAAQAGYCKSVQSHKFYLYVKRLMMMKV